MDSAQRTYPPPGMQDGEQRAPLGRPRPPASIFCDNFRRVDIEQLLTTITLTSRKDKAWPPRDGFLAFSFYDGVCRAGNFPSWAVEKVKH